MLNLTLGSAVTVDDRSCIAVPEGVAGHAIYGPYEQREAGKYIVRLGLQPAAAVASPGNAIAARIEVAGEGGNTIYSRRDVAASELQDGYPVITVPFTLRRPAKSLEYRVWVTGHVPLLIDDHQFVIEIPAGTKDVEAFIAARIFPDQEGQAIPFFRDNRAMLRRLYERGERVTIEGDEVVVTLQGITLSARRHDDLFFIGEVFAENVYNFKTDRDVCAIDIGMNVGLSSLMFAQKHNVKEVHSFEPFQATYDRAVRNIALNTHFGGKIRPHNFGLSD